MEPVIGSIYTLEQIINGLELKPYLEFKVYGKESVVQDSHVTKEELLSVPGFSATQWMYTGTVGSVCIFKYADRSPITSFLHITVNGGGVWATPKGFPSDEEPA